MVCKPADAEAFHSAGARVEVSPHFVERTPGRLIWEQFGLPAMARRIRADVIHSVHYTFPILTTRSRVVTVHDLTFFSDPGVHTRTKGRFFRAWIRALARTRAVAVTPSAATAGELTTRTRFAPARVVVAHLAVDRDRFHRPDPAAVDAFAARYVLDHGWIAFLGTLEPRKNVVALLDAYARLADARDGRPLPALVLAGGRGWDDGVGPAIDRAREAGADVRLAGYLPLDELPALLGGAIVVAYPSLGEGFGLPVLEAMACGACVLTTRRLSLPEVGGDAVAYTETDARSISTALSDLLDDAATRDGLRGRAVQRAHGFTWEASAEQHLRAYAIATGSVPSD